MKKIRLISNGLLLLAVLASACAPAVSSQTATATSEHHTKPNRPVYQQLVWDCNTGKTLTADYSTSGPIQPDSGCDSWQLNRYERPFNKETQDKFFPDLDILSAELGSDGTWFYFRLTIFDKNQVTAKLDGTYAVEMDLDLDGRGDVLALVHQPGDKAQQDWTTDGVAFIGDINNDVGNNIPMAPDPPNKGNGYDTIVFDQGKGDDPDLVWVRTEVGKPSTVEIAFKASAIANDPRFKWWAWSDEGVDNPAGADYHDTFDHPQAGDPNQGQQFFPSKLINELDNTCSVIWGARNGEDADLCVNDSSVPGPTLESSSTPFLDLTETPTPEDRTPTPTEELTESITPTIPFTQNSATVTLTETATPTITETPTMTMTATPCYPNPNAAVTAPQPTCTPTSTWTPTFTPSPTTCYSLGAYLTNQSVSTCTPTPTPTYTPTPTGCPNPISSTAPQTTCTPTPPPCYGPITAGVTNQIATCTPTVTPTPTECVQPYPFAVIPCEPTDTPTPTVTATLCTPVGATLLQQAPCTPTPTQCVAINAAGLAVVNCTPTPTPTMCLVGTIIGTDTAGYPIYAYAECTPTVTPTLCTSTNAAGLVTPCTPTPQAAGAMMVYPDEDTNCRKAPGDQNIVGTLLKGVGYNPLGRSPDSMYMLFRAPLSGQRCWAASFLFTIPFDINLLPVFLLPTVTPTPTKTPASSAAPQCNDGKDNDGDGKIDYHVSTSGAVTGDPQCASPTDNNESS